MDERFSRNMGTITPREQERLAGSHVFVAGCGGIGGYIIEHLVRMGVGHIVCADDGRFEISNLNRQILSDVSVLGREKTECARERALHIWPEADVRGIYAHMDADSLPDMLRGCDLALDALDNIATRRMLFAVCQKEGIPVVHAAVRGWLVQAAFVLPNGKLYDMLYQENYDEKGKQTVMSFAPGMAASIQAALAVRYLCSHACDNDLHFCDMQTMTFSRVKI